MKCDPWGERGPGGSPKLWMNFPRRGVGVSPPAHFRRRRPRSNRSRALKSGAQTSPRISMKALVRGLSALRCGAAGDGSEAAVICGSMQPAGQRGKVGAREQWGPSRGAGNVGRRPTGPFSARSAAGCGVKKGVSVFAKAANPGQGE